MLILSMLFGAFQPPKPEPGGPAAVLPREKTTQKLVERKKLNLIRTLNPEFKDLAQTWGWKPITVHERMYTVAIKCVLQRES